MASSPEEKEELTTTIELNSEELDEDNKVESESKASLSTTGDLENPIVTAAETAVADGKINLILKATADVPIMKKKRWQVDESKTIHWVITFIKKYLKLEDKDTIFLYIAQAFAPAPDQQIKNLYQSFGSDGKLILHYSKTPAWG